MINNYISHLQEKEESLNEFIVLPLLMVLIRKLYKKHLEHKKILENCLGLSGKEKKKCFIVHKLLALKKIKNTIRSLKGRCSSEDEKKCVKKINREITKIDKEIASLKTKLGKI